MGNFIYTPYKYKNSYFAQKNRPPTMMDVVRRFGTVEQIKEYEQLAKKNEQEKKGK